MKRATLVVPVYNEFPEIHQFMEILLSRAFLHELEVIVVDDGSTDGTSDVLNNLNIEFQNFILLRHESNKGYGASLKTGIWHASTKTIVITDADGSYPLEIIPKMLDTYEQKNVDMVVGARVGREARVPWMRRPPKWVLNKLCNILTGEKIPDINSGLRVFRRQVAMDHIELLCDEFSFTTTITLIMHTQNYPVAYIPISYHDRSGISKIRPLYDTINFLMLILTTIIFYKPLKVLFPVALFILAAGGGLSMAQALLYRDISTSSIILIASGFNVLILSLIADLIVKSRKL